MSETLANGRYEIVRRLAAGGMGEVLLAEYRGDVELSAGLLVVKRVLSAAPGVDPAEGAVKMLREEGRLGQRLMHGNLVETFRIDESQPTNPLLVIELLAGRSMAQVLGQAKKRKENVPVDVALAILRGSCCGLHFAHTLKDGAGRALGLVHRDVSPANIFVTFDGRVKVIDFGVAKSEDSEIKTATGILKGKLGYMSPEQSLGAAKLSAQADVWSLGVFFWEMLVAERLFSSPNPTATLLQISQKEIPRPSTLRPDVPPAVEAICMRMLERELADRYLSCADVARAIDALPATASLDRGGGVSRVDVGAFLAGRFPDEAEAGAKDAARCSRKVRSAPIPTGLVDGGARDAAPGDDDDLATAVVTADTRADVLRAVAAERALAAERSAQQAAIDEEDVATIRVTADIVAEARREAALLSAAGPRNPAHIGHVGADEEQIATAAVPEVAMAQLRERVARDHPSTAHKVPWSTPTQEDVPFPASVTAPHAPEPPPPPTLAPGFPPSPPPPPWAPNLPVSPTPPPMAAPQPPPAARTPPARQPEPARSRPGSPAPGPLGPGLQLSGPLLAPPVSASRPRATSLPSGPAPAAGPTTSWLAVALSTFGALVLVMGVGFSFAISRPPPRSVVVYSDPAGFDVVVVDAAHVPPGAPQRLVDVAHPVLRRSGDVEAKAVPAAELQQRLTDAGLWTRASLPSTTRTTLAALLPVLIAALGLLALAFAVPAFFWREGRSRLLARAALVAAVVVISAVVVERGALSWPGRAAYRQQPRLEWR